MSNEILRQLKSFNELQNKSGHCDKIEWDGKRWTVIHHPYGCEAEKEIASGSLDGVLAKYENFVRCVSKND